MRSITILIAIHLLIASLLSNSEFAGMMRMGNLVSHFYHHIEEHQEDINVFEFLALHYLDQQHLQHDKHEHHELPVKSHNTQTFSSCYLPSFKIVVAGIFTNLFFDDSISYATYFDQIFSAPLIDIWQPPKLG